MSTALKNVVISILLRTHNHCLMMDGKAGCHCWLCSSGNCTRQLVIYDGATQSSLVGFLVVATLYMVTCYPALKLGQKFAQRWEGEVDTNWCGQKKQTWPFGTREQLEVQHTKTLLL